MNHKWNDGMIPFAKLRYELRKAGYNYQRFGEAIHRSVPTISLRMNNVIPWNLDEIHDTCDLLHIPKYKIPEYFPRGGFPEKDGGMNEQIYSD